MNTVTHIIEQAQARGVQLRAEGGEVQVTWRGPRPVDLIDSIKTHKSELICVLNKGNAVSAPERADEVHNIAAPVATSSTVSGPEAPVPQAWRAELETWSEDRREEWKERVAIMSEHLYALDEQGQGQLRPGSEQALDEVERLAFLDVNLRHDNRKVQ